MSSFTDFLKSIFQQSANSAQVDDGPADEIYRAYATEFDLEVDAIDLADVIAGASPDLSKGWLELEDHGWNTAVNSANAIYTNLLAEMSGDLGTLSSVDQLANLENHSISILIDQSGSMKGQPMAQAAAVSKLLMKTLNERGAKTELLGFSTCGWHGGFARKRWLANGRPSRPGRLCSLMHIVYKDADEETLNEQRWQAMLNPNILRENVDGEALMWATSRLSLHSETHKTLVIISDGAPVDDSTLTQNGPSYLEKHLRKVIESIEGDSDIALAAIGIGYAVDRFYSRSVAIKNATDLPKATAAMLKRVLGRPNVRGTPS